MARVRPLARHRPAAEPRRVGPVTIAPEGRKMLRLEVRNAETPIEKKPAWIKTRAQDGPEYQELQALVKSRGPAHGLPRGRLPQHLRVLGRPRGDVPHRRRPVHPALRLLPDRHRASPSRSTGRAVRVAESVRTMGLRYATVTGVVPRRPRGRGRLAVRRDDPHRSTSSTRASASRCSLPTSAAAPSFLGQLFDAAARGVRPQHRDGAPDLPADPPRLPL